MARLGMGSERLGDLAYIGEEAKARTRGFPGIAPHGGAAQLRFSHRSDVAGVLKESAPGWVEHDMTRTYVFAFDPEPEGGYTITCPALPGLVSYGETIEEAREMAHDAMEGLIEVMLEHGEDIPESDWSDTIPRFARLAHMLLGEGRARPLFERLT